MTRRSMKWSAKLSLERTLPDALDEAADDGDAKQEPMESAACVFAFQDCACAQDKPDQD